MNGLYELDGVAPTLPDGDDIWVAPGAHVMGNVILGQGVSVWFNAVIRGDNDPITIGENTTIQDGTVLHSDPGSPLTIGAACTIGHTAPIHGCHTGRTTLIALGATVMTGAKIGHTCLAGRKAVDA